MTQRFSGNSKSAPTALNSRFAPRGKLGVFAGQISGRRNLANRSPSRDGRNSYGFFVGRIPIPYHEV